MSDTQNKLELLRPTTKTNVMTLLELVGHDISHWSVRSDESPVKVPAANPNYCYDWAFGSQKEGIVLCVWHQSIAEDGQRLIYRENMRSLDDGLTEIASTSGRDSKERDRARQQAKRARDFDSLIRTAHDRHSPVRFIVNDGDRADREELGTSSSHVWKRALDDTPWFVHQYDDRSGDFLLVRGIEPTHDSVEGALAIDSRGEEDARQYGAIKIRRGQAEFRNRLLSAWGQRCVVTGCRVLGLLEAAHIRPHAEETDYRTSNGLLLRSDIHTLYDLGLLSIDEFMRVHVADELLASEYRVYAGKKIEHRPDRFTDSPSPENLVHRHLKFMQKASAG